MIIGTSLDLDSICHVAQFANDANLIRVYASARMFSFLRPRVERVMDERGLLIGSIMRVLAQDGGRATKLVLVELGRGTEDERRAKLKDVRDMLLRVSIDKLRKIYKLV